MTMPQRVAQDLLRQGLAEPSTRVVVALSGGGDSVALLFLMRQLAAEGRLILAGAAHLHHQLRGAEADADEAFCRVLCARLNLPLVVDRRDVAVRARAEKRSIEDAARTIRYQFLHDAAVTLDAERIATGHTRDDQAETFLLRLLRGAGPAGLAAIHPRVGKVIRPLLDCTREDLRRYLGTLNESFRDDASNADVSIPRNRIRHELLPILSARFTPRAVEVLARDAALAARDEDFLDRQAIEMAAGIVLAEHATEIRLDAVGLRSLHPAVASRLARGVLSRFATNRPIEFQHVERLLALAQEISGGSVSLPGQSAIRQGETIVLRPGRSQPQAVNSFCFLLSIPGEVQVGGWAVGAAEPDSGVARLTKWRGRGREVGVAAADLVLPLVVRNRRPGDRFRPLGAPGIRKLQDFLVDRKVPREERDALPLVADGAGRIVWVAGNAVADQFRIRDPEQAVILLTLRRLGPVAGHPPDGPAPTPLKP